ncbi:unnamed protein product [Clavelina lepadiformis]|uniref:HAT C-terminal dimerisation domain-containing protein n=1 Tax=Clavelina lepadiformis TaxID=159417 RepID=A0ABP0G808_CLALP
MHFDEDPLMYWKKKSEELPTLATLAKDYLGLTATSAPSERISSIAGNARRNLLGSETLRTLMFIKCNPTVFEQVKMLSASSVSTLSCKQPQLLSERIVVNQSRSMVVKGNVVGEGEVISCSVQGQIQ